MAWRGKKLPVEAMPPAVHFALDKTLNSTLHAVRPVSVLPLLLSLGVDYRKSSLISLVRVFETSIMVLTFFKSASYSLVKVVTCAPNCRCCSTSVLAHLTCACCSRSLSESQGQGTRGKPQRANPSDPVSATQ